MKIVTRQIQHVLSSEEIETRISQSSKASARCLELEKQKRQYLKDLRKERVRLEKLIKQSLYEVDRGRIDIEAPCEEVKNFALERVEYWFKGRMADCRPMLEEDRQLDFAAKESNEAGLA